MASVVSTVIALVSVICGTLMYYNMRRSLELKTLRSEVSLVLNSSTKIGSDDTAAADDSIVQRIEQIVRTITAKRLSDMKKDIQKLKEDERIIRSLFIETCAEVEDTASHMSLLEVNYADEILGARIEKVEAQSVEPKRVFSFFGKKCKENSPENILCSCMKPGCCFGFRGSQAVVTIALSKSIYMDAVELQHIPKYKSPSKETSSAPRQFKIEAISSSNVLIHLGDFEFDNHQPFQIFPIRVDRSCQRLRVQFLTNHGNPNFTCVYRFAVYGRT